MLLFLMTLCSDQYSCVCIVLRLAAEGATTPGITGSQKETGVRFKADCNLGKSLSIKYSIDQMYSFLSCFI